MAETGILTPDDQTELINGIVMKMSPTRRRLNHIARTIARQLPDNLEINLHSTIRLPNQTAQDRQNIPGPTDLLLIVEATAPSLHPTAKPQRYAQSNIPELWIFPLESPEIEAHRQPPRPNPGLTPAYMLPYTPNPTPKKERKK